VSDSKKFGTRDPAHTAPPGSASTFYVSGSVFEYLRWLEEIPGPMLPNRARAWTRLRDGWRSRDAPSGSTRNTLATLEVWRGTECTHFHERAYPNSLSARVPRQRVDSPSRCEAGLATSGATPQQTDCLRRPTRAAGSSRGRPPPAVFGPAVLARVLGAPERWGNRRP
jgi:hypothetical protein